MPFFLSERLPLPSLRSYCIVSVLIFCAAIFQARNLITKSESVDSALLDVFGKDSFCLWAVINIAYCLLFLFGKVIQRFVFGDLRVIEEQHLQEKFWNFVFYKVIFVFGIINSQTLTEVMCWAAWFSMLGFWHIFGQLSKDRYEFLTSSPNTSSSSHAKLLCLLVTILTSSICMAAAAYYSDFAEGWNIFGFMISECVLLGLKSLHIIFKYCIQLRDGYRREIWEGKATLSYYSDLAFECLIYAVDFIYHIHMLIWSYVFLSMASLVLYWNICSIFSELTKRLNKHKIYRKITKNINEKFPSLSKEELEELEDHCAICWDDMKTARKLPCGHIFHQACLCSWLQQDTSCPTCRMALAGVMGLPERAPPPMVGDDLDMQQFPEPQQQGNQRNHFFHFDGSRIANWFPSFSIEVFHGANQDGIADQELEEMAVQVHTMFPNIPHDVILEDLRQTRSSEVTAENILEGNIAFPQHQTTEEIASNEPQPEFEEIPPDTQREEEPPTAVNQGLELSDITLSESAEESSDASSCVEFFDDSDRRHDLLRRRRHRFLTEARRRFTTKSNPAAVKDVSPGPKPASTSTTLKRNKPEHDDRRIRVLQAIERRILKTDQPQQQQNELTEPQTEPQTESQTERESGENQ